MKIKVLMLTGLMGLLVGCGGTNQDRSTTQQTPTPVESTNEFEGVSFPRDSCGDELPEDPQAYPVEFYPVFIDYSDSNLQAVKSKFCRDALKKHRKSLGKDSIQIASFIGKERANQFRELMQREFGSGEIGEVSVIQAPRNTVVQQSDFDPASFPRDSCYDELPEDPQAYPVELYHVFIDYSESNLQTVRSKLCRDALKKDRTFNQSVIQVASLVGTERANQFKELMQKEFGNVEIGELFGRPIVIEAPPKPNNAAQQFDLNAPSFPQEYCGDKLPEDATAYPLSFYPLSVELNSNSSGLFHDNFCRVFAKYEKENEPLVGYFVGKERANQFKNIIQTRISGTVEIGEPIVIKKKLPSSEEVAKAAKLSPQQLKGLMELAQNSELGSGLKIILPTYIPKGFEITRFSYQLRRHIGTPNYEIDYRNKSNSCSFRISGSHGGRGAGPSNYEKIEALSIASGRITLNHTGFDKLGNVPGAKASSFSGILGAGPNGFFLYDFSYSNKCNTTSVQEIVKIVESLQYLNPY